MTNVANWKITIFYRKIHYFDWAIFHSYVCLPEGILLGFQQERLPPNNFLEFIDQAWGDGDGDFEAIQASLWREGHPLRKNVFKDSFLVYKKLAERLGLNATAAVVDVRLAWRCTWCGGLPWYDGGWRYILHLTSTATWWVVQLIKDGGSFHM